jgi:hypothetical protein
VEVEFRMSRQFCERKEGAQSGAYQVVVLAPREADEVVKRREAAEWQKTGGCALFDRVKVRVLGGGN